MDKTTADLLVERLIDWDVDTIFGYPGDGVNGIFEALRTHQDRITYIQVRHEEAAAFAACGYARYTGRMGVCLATSGPGGIHLLNGLYDAAMDNQPVLAITPAIPSTTSLAHTTSRMSTSTNCSWTSRSITSA
jgi:thiamine pyrophosphate-dependent acetolactate synthase large subunit-like protein